MELNKITLLLDKYFDGDSNTKEEALLKDYFLSETVDPSLEHYKPLFRFYAAEKDTKQPVHLKIVQTKKRKTNWILIAASVAVILGIGSYTLMQYNNNYITNNQSELGTYNDPEVALKETQKALALLSTHVNTGVEGMQYIQEFENTKNKIFNP
ncbi:hypothetical protein, partial [Flavobacterium sp.]|uniref:hypothetical protein n=1 Tax=Flavobacterium sp. TaxID=239 RepID=UPI002627678C